MASIQTYLNKPANQILQVAESALTGADVIANPNPPTAGALKGWMVLVAPAGGCVVDATAFRMRLRAGSQKILWVSPALGSKWQFQGRFDCAGDHIWFWHPDASFPVPGDVQAFKSPFYNSPDCWNFAGATNCRVYGGMSHTGADIIDTSGGVLNLIGHYVKGGYGSNGSVWHSDLLDGVASAKTTSIGVSHCTLDGNHVAHPVTPEPSSGHSWTGIFTDCWVTNGIGNAWDPGKNADGTVGPINLSIGTTFSFGNVNNGIGTNAPVVLNGGPTLSTPSGTLGVDDPASKWQAQNPPTSWQTFVDFDFLPPPAVTGATWKDRMGNSPGTVGSNWTDTEFATDLANLQTYGSWARLDMNWAVVYGAGWRSSARTLGWSSMDALVAKYVGAGTKKFIMCADMPPGGPAALTTAPRTYPDRANATDWGNFCADVATRYAPGGVGGVPADGDLWVEVWNEPNANGKNSAGQSDYVEYAWLFKVATDAITSAAPATKVMTGAPAVSSTNVNDGSSNLHGFVYNSGIGTLYAPDDWYHNLMSDQAGLLTDPSNPKINGKFQGIGVHPYSSSQGPLGNHGTAILGVPAGDFNGFRLLASIQFIARASGNSAANSKMHATEIGYDTCEYVANGNTYTTNDVVYLTGDGLNPSWSQGSLTQPRWTRTARYIRTGTGTNLPPGTGWAIHSDGATTYDTIAGSSVNSEAQQAQNYQDALDVWFGRRPDTDGNNLGDWTGIICFYHQRDLDATRHGQRFDAHMGIINRRTGASKGALAVLAAAADNPLGTSGTGKGSLALGATTTAAGTKQGTGITLIPFGLSVTPRGIANRTTPGTTLLPFGAVLGATGRFVATGDPGIVPPLFSTPTSHGIRTDRPASHGIRKSIPRARNKRGTRPTHPGLTATENER